MAETQKQFVRSFIPGLLFVTVFFIIHLIDENIDLDFNKVGLYPRTAAGLIGIITMPFLHSDWGHLAGNALPFFILMGYMFLYYPRVAKDALLWMFIMTGVWVWVFARPSYHVGASGLIYAMASYLFFSGVFRKDTASITVSLIVTFLYGSMIWGIVPVFNAPISWEGHLCGGFAGLFTAFVYRQVALPKKVVLDDDDSLNEARFGEGYWKIDPDPKPAPPPPQQPFTIKIHYVEKPRTSSESDDKDSSTGEQR